MSSAQPYQQGLVPAIQQMQMAAPIQAAPVQPQPNAGQDSYLTALQDQIKQSQQTQAQGMQAYQNQMGQQAAANKQAAASGDDDPLSALFGTAIKLAPLLLL